MTPQFLGVFFFFLSLSKFVATRFLCRTHMASLVATQHSVTLSCALAFARPALSCAAELFVMCGRAFCHGQLCHDRNVLYASQLCHDIISPCLSQLCRDIKILCRNRKPSQPGQLGRNMIFPVATQNLSIWPYSIAT